MQVVITQSAEQVAKLGAKHCYDLINVNPAAVLGLATGSTPVALYGQLIDLYRRNLVSYCLIKSFNLDEYVGLVPTHPQSYRYFMNHHLFNHIDINLKNTFVPDGMTAPAQAGEQYEKAIANAGGIDLQILGVGRNGHIGFNEPSSSLSSRTRIKTLTAATVKDNNRFFATDEFQPELAITMGIGTILEAKKILLLATGKAKAKAVKHLVEGSLSASCPASALQLHNNTTVIIDQEAAELLEHKEYYKQVAITTEQMATENA